MTRSQLNKYIIDLIICMVNSCPSISLVHYANGLAVKILMELIVLIDWLKREICNWNYLNFHIFLPER